MTTTMTIQDECSTLDDMIDTEQAREEANEPVLFFCLFFSSFFRMYVRMPVRVVESRIFSFFFFAVQGIEWLRLLQLLPRQKETMTTKSKQASERARERERKKNEH